MKKGPRIFYLLLIVSIFTGCRLPNNKGQNLLIFKFLIDSKKDYYATIITIKEFSTGETYTSSWVDYYEHYCVLQKIPKGRYYITNITFMAGQYRQWIDFKGQSLVLKVDGSSIQYFGSYETVEKKIIRANIEEEQKNLNELANFFNVTFKNKGWTFNSEKCYTPLLETTTIE